LEKFKNDTKIICYSKNINDKGKMAYNVKIIDKPIHLNSDNISISEINYHVFKIPSIDYFLSLYETKKSEYFTVNSNKYSTYANQNCFNFDNDFLQKQFSNDKIMIGNNIFQTSITRLRHVLAHGGSIKTEIKYNEFNKNPNLYDDVTKKFYEQLENNNETLLNESIQKLLNIQIK
jgi:hypothetical protein